jgi:hypothetical protein
VAGRRSKPATPQGKKKSAAKFDAADFFIPPAPAVAPVAAAPVAPPPPVPVQRAALAMPAPPTFEQSMQDLEGDAAVKEKRRTLLVYIEHLPCWRCNGTVAKGGHDTEYCPLFWHLDYRAMSELRSISHKRKEYIRKGGEL